MGKTSFSHQSSERQEGGVSGALTVKGGHEFRKKIRTETHTQRKENDWGKNLAARGKGVLKRDCKAHQREKKGWEKKREKNWRHDLIRL